MERLGVVTVGRTDCVPITELGRHERQIGDNTAQSESTEQCKQQPSKAQVRWM